MMGKKETAQELRRRKTFEEVVSTLNVDDMARGDAESCIPGPNDTEPTLNERTIIDYFRDSARKARNFAKDDLDKLKEQMSEIYHSRIIEELKGCPNALLQLNNDSRRRENQELLDLRKDALKREADVKKFAKDNGLKREPQPPGSPMQITFWIAAIVLMETLLNATFFAHGSDRGLLGGAIQAFVISFINVMLAWLLGRFGLTRLGHCQPDQKYLGYAIVLTLVTAAFTLNMFAGHYRAALEGDAFKAVLLAVESFKSNFMSIKSAQGWLLTAVGGTAFTCLTIKIFQSDDPYLGYGKVNREYLNARDTWMERQREFTDTIIDNFNRIESKRATDTDTLGKLEVRYGVLLDKVVRLVELYDSSLKQEEALCNQVVNYYRKENKDFRSNQNDVLPPYFSKPVSLGLSDFSLDPEMEDEKMHQQEIAQKFHDYRTNDSARMKSELDGIHKQEIDNLDEYFGNVS
ncbi:hypothetical protein [Pseudodesulfovibrio sp. zrk46]|uniref:hypothetical protein n=1 Tax=Pseudodesulfovibrio sp. zrk46 TaxID=2725288 RepID=UPI001448AB7F|nr:hypothetical protein [Pseudodesulfovibrio sp. zrk46]QJB55628.1 hypothetical protein HFN16_04105 [Pseudodesulfovibrio sp. zrk46]